MEHRGMPSFLCQAHSPHSPGGCDFGRFKVCLTVTTVLLPAGGGCTAGMARMTHELWTHCSMGWHPATVETNGLFCAVVPSLKYGSVKTMGFPFANACTIKKKTYAVRHIWPQCVDESVNAILQKKQTKKRSGGGGGACDSFRLPVCHVHIFMDLICLTCLTYHLLTCTSHPFKVPLWTCRLI